jgi:hypothetical protein
VTEEFKRLGKRGSYRLGDLRARGGRVPARPVPFRPWFSRPDHRLPVSGWLLLLLLGAVVIAVSAVPGWWFMPFAMGLVAGVANRAGNWRTRVALPAVALMGAFGWGLPLCWQTAAGQPYATVAREVAALAGLPGGAMTGLACTVLLAVLQAVVGYWLGRALTPRPGR